MSGSQSNVLREFLIKLGYRVDESGQRKFTSSIKTATLEANLLASALEATARRALEFMRAQAESAERMYWISQNTGVAVSALQRLGFGFSNVGGSADTANAVFEKMASFLRNTGQGGEAFIKTLTGAAYKAGDLAHNLAALRDRWREMLADQNRAPLAIAEARVLGISENELLVISRQTQEFEKLSERVNRRLGLNADESAKRAQVTMNNLRGTGLVLDRLYQKVFDELQIRLGPQIGRFNEYLLSHAGEITDYLENLFKRLEHLAVTVNEVVKNLGGWERVLKTIIAIRILTWITSFGGAAITAAIGVIRFATALTTLSLAVAGFNTASVTGGLAVLARLIGFFGAAAVGAYLGLTIGKGDMATPEQDQTRWLDPNTGKIMRRRLDGTVEVDPDQSQRPDATRGQQPTGRETTPGQQGANTIPPEGQALLAELAQRESGNDPTALYGGGHFTDMSHFPNWAGLPGPDGRLSHAAGLYQFQPDTWEEAAAATGLRDFSVASQTQNAWWLAQSRYARAFPGHDLLTDLREHRNLPLIGTLLHPTWQAANQGAFAAALADRLSRMPATVAPRAVPAIPGGGTPLSMNTPDLNRSVGEPSPSQVAQNTWNVSHSTNVTVHGANDPQRVADHVERAVDRGNNNFVRYLRGAYT